MPKRIPLPEERKEAFLSALREKFSVGAAARIAGIGRRTVYDWAARDPEFAAAMDDCREDALDDLEATTFEKALTDDSPLRPFFLLKGHRHHYRDNFKVEVSGGLELLAAPILLQRLREMEQIEAQVIDVEPVTEYLPAGESASRE